MSIKLNQAAQPLSQPYQLANDSEMRLLLGYSAPPRAGKIKAYSGGVYTVEIADGEDATVQATALNGYVYSEDTVVYVLQASNAPDSGVIVGSQGFASQLSVGAANPDGPLHAEDTTGVFAVLSASDVGAVEQTLSSGSISKAIMGDVMLLVGSTRTAMALSLSVPAESYHGQSITIGESTYQFRLYSTGELRVFRRGGTDPADVIMRVLWI